MKLKLIFNMRAARASLAFLFLIAPCSLSLHAQQPDAPPPPPPPPPPPAPPPPPPPPRAPRRHSSRSRPLRSPARRGHGSHVPPFQEHALLALWPDEFHFSNQSSIPRRLQRKKQPQIGRAH